MTLNCDAFGICFVALIPTLRQVLTEFWMLWQLETNRLNRINYRGFINFCQIWFWRAAIWSMRKILWITIEYLNKIVALMPLSLPKCKNTKRTRKNRYMLQWEKYWTLKQNKGNLIDYLHGFGFEIFEQSLLVTSRQLHRSFSPLIFNGRFRR